MFRLPKPTSRKALIITHDLLATVAAIVASFYIRFEDQGLGSRLEGLLGAARLRRLRGDRLLLLPALRGKVAVRLASRSVQHLPGRERARRLASGPGLYSALAEILRHVLLRQDHDRSLLVPPDVVSGRAAHHLSLFPLHPHAPSCGARGLDADPGARARGRRRGLDPGDRERRGEEDLAGRRPVPVTGRPGTGDPRHSGAWPAG